MTISGMSVFILFFIFLGTVESFPDALEIVPWKNCTKPDCRTIDCTNHQFTEFDCPSISRPISSVQKLMLQNNFITFFSITDVLTCFPKLKFVNLYGNPINNLECGLLSNALEVVYNCTQPEKACNPLMLPTCCCFPPFTKPDIDPCQVTSTPASSSKPLSTFTSRKGQNHTQTTIFDMSTATFEPITNSTWYPEKMEPNLVLYISAIIGGLLLVIICLIIAFVIWRVRVNRLERGGPTSEESSEGEVVIFERGPYLVRSLSEHAPRSQSGNVHLRRSESLRFSRRPPSIHGFTVPTQEMPQINRSIAVRGSLTQRNPPPKIAETSI